MRTQESPTAGKGASCVTAIGVIGLVTRCSTVCCSKNAKRPASGGMVCRPPLRVPMALTNRPSEFSSMSLKMPFLSNYVKPFTRVEIEALNPNQMGVYGIFRDGVWIYIGRGDLRDRLLAHLNGDIPCIWFNAPTHFIAEVAANPVAREIELLQEIITTCNQRIG
jgi:hypothetical protein